jgi:hypothetical protein
MKVKQIQNVVKAGTVETSALLDGERVWFRYPEIYASKSGIGDAFLCAALLPAMKTGEPLEIELPVSGSLLKKLNEIQLVRRMWNHDYKIIEIIADVADNVPETSGVASFFSGGIDSSYTFLNHKDEIDYLVLVQGIDMHVTNNDLFQKVKLNNERFAEKYGKKLITIQSNLVHYSRRTIGTWAQFTGLQCFAYPLGFSRFYIPASHTYSELFPWGSHPFLDPLWSTEYVEFIHDGAGAYRSDKLEKVAADASARELMRVCWHKPDILKGETNCGNCEKCLRTMAGLRALGISVPTLPQLNDLKKLKQLRVSDLSDHTFFSDNLNLALEKGDAELARALERILSRAKARKALIDLDEAVFSGALKGMIQPILNWRYDHGKKEEARLYATSDEVDISLVK